MNICKKIVRFQLRLLLTMCMCVNCLICPQCDKIHCSPKNPSKLVCAGGITTGICDCCPACARIEGEKCGGYYHYLGKCDTGLYCEPLSKQTKSTALHQSLEPEGVCKKAPVPVKDQPLEQRKSCRRKCTPDLCTEHPTAICSAVDVAEFLQPCQSTCQHTSCSACKFITQPACRKCGKDDFQCLRKFGQCIRKDACSRRKFPCQEKYFSLQQKFLLEHSNESITPDIYNSKTIQNTCPLFTSENRLFPSKCMIPYCYYRRPQEPS